MPKKPTPPKAAILLRLPENLKTEIHAIAEKRGETASTVIRDFIRRGVGDAA